MTDNENESNNFLDAATVQRFDDLYVLLKDNISDIDFKRVEQEGKISPVDLIVEVDKVQINNLLTNLKNNSNLQFNYLRCLTAVDYVDEGIEVVYQLYSLEKLHNLTIKVMLKNDDLSIDSAANIWRGANWYERETSEMFGIIFNNHPDPRNLLLPEDMIDVFPLRKSHPLAEIEVLQGEGIEPSGNDAGS